MRFVLFLLCSAIVCQSNAQFIHEKSQELFFNSIGRQYGVVPAGEHGVIVFTETKNNATTLKRKWEILKLDSNLEIEWRSYFESDFNYKLTQVQHAGDYMYLMFEDSNVPIKSVFFARAKINDQSLDFFEIKEFFPRDIIGFEILGNSLFLVGMDENGPAILKFRYGDPRPKALRGLYNENNELLSVEIVPNHNLIQIIARMKKNSGGKYMLLVKQFDEQGEIHQDIVIESNKGHNLLGAKARTDQQGSVCVVGTFAYGNSKLSNGIFTMVYGGEERQSVYYYDYTNLHNFFTYLPEKEQAKMERKYTSTDGGNKRNNYRINHVPREVMKVGDQWVYIGETVKYIERNSRVYGLMWAQEYRRYANSLILGIAANGRLQWDNSIGMDNLTTPSARQQVFMDPYGPNSIVYFLHGFQLYFSIFDDREALLEQGSFAMEPPSFAHENMESQHFGEILPLIDGSFLTFGSLTREETFGVENHYFYINKIAIAPPE